MDRTKTWNIFLLLHQLYNQPSVAVEEPQLANNANGLAYQLNKWIQMLGTLQ